MEVPRQFSYAGRWIVLLGVFAFCAIATLLFGHEARTRTSFAAAFHWVFATFSGAYALLTIFLLFRNVFFGPPLLEFGLEDVVVPHGFFHRKAWRVRYDDIFAISEERTHGGKCLILQGSNSFARISASLLPDDDTYQLIKDFLFARAHVARQRPKSP